MTRYAALALLAGLLQASTALAAAPAKERGDTPEARLATRALNTLEAQGFAAGLQDRDAMAVRDFHAQGADFVAAIAQNGRNYVVTVDPATGQVIPQD